MSRSALWRQEAGVKERERQANEIFFKAVEEGKNAKVRGAIPLVGPHDTFNLNPMLIQNIAKSPYFQKCCTNLLDWSALVDEIYYEVNHVEPFTVGGFKDPSSAFCLLVRLFTLRCTEKQMSSMLQHIDSPYIRCIGFLYLRYAADPTLLWNYVEPYLYDEEQVQVSSDPKRGEGEITIGEYVRKLLTDMNYYGTVLPRLPLNIEREIKVNLLLAEQKEERAVKHIKQNIPDKYFIEGATVRALYGDEENSITWYDAIIDRVVVRDDETGEPLVRPKYHVTFPEYGNSEIVTLGDMDLGSSSSSSTSGGGGGDGGGRGRGGGRDYDDDRRGGRAGWGDRGGFRWKNDRNDHGRGNYNGHDAAAPAASSSHGGGRSRGSAKCLGKLRSTPAQPGEKGMWIVVGRSYVTWFADVHVPFCYWHVIGFSEASKMA